jgi:hypothetical protein
MSREIQLYRSNLPPLVIASDGRLDEKSPASIAVLLVDLLDGTRWAMVAEVPLVLRKAWEADSEKYIALVEQSAVVMGLTMAKSIMRNRDFYWYEDNAVVLAGLSKGSSNGEELDKGNAAIHLLMAELRSRGWFEYIESKSNWSDGASRLLEGDPWIREHNFVTTRGEVPTWPWLASAEERLARVRSSCS